MAYTSSWMRLAEDASGRKVLMFQDGTTLVNVQGVALVDEAGEHVGHEDHGLHVVSVAFEHFEIHEGDSYNWSEVITLGSAATQDYLITVANTTKWPHFSYVIEGSFGIRIDLYEGADRTGTTLQTTFNRQRNSLNTAAMTIHKGHSGGTTDGTLIYSHKSGTGAAGGKLSGSSSEASERILAQNTKYILRVTSAAASNDIALSLNWYEHTFA